MRIMENTNVNDTGLPVQNSSLNNGNIHEDNSDNNDSDSDSLTVAKLEKDDECFICTQPMGNRKSVLSNCNHEICVDCVDKIKKHNFKDFDKKYFQCPFDRTVNLTATTTYSNSTVKLLPDTVVHIIDECDKIRKSSKFKFKTNFLTVNKELFKIKALHDTGYCNLGQNVLTNLSNDHVSYFINLKQNAVRYGNVERKDWRLIFNELESLSSALIESYLPWIYIISNFSQIISDIQNDNDQTARACDSVEISPNTNEQTIVKNDACTSTSSSKNKSDSNKNTKTNKNFINTDNVDIQKLKKAHNDYVVEYLYKFIIESYVILTTSVLQYDLFDGDEYLEICPLSFKRHPYRRCLICFSKFDESGYVRLECCDHKICVRCIKLGHYFLYICPLHTKKYSFQRIFFNNNMCVKELQLALLCVFNKTLDLEAQLIEYILRDISIYAQIVQLVKKVQQKSHRGKPTSELTHSEKTLLQQYTNDWVILDMENEKKMLSFLNYVFLISFSHQSLIMCWQYIMEAKRFLFEWIYKHRNTIRMSMKTRMTYMEISEFLELQEYERQFTIWFSILQGSSAEICVLQEELRQSYPDDDYLYFNSNSLYTGENELEFSSYITRFSIIRNRKKLLKCYNLYPLTD